MRDDKMTLAEHQARHQVLHTHFDELMADYLIHHRVARPSNTTCIQLMEWSHRQTQSPDPDPGTEHKPS